MWRIKVFTTLKKKSFRVYIKENIYAVLLSQKVYVAAN